MNIITPDSSSKTTGDSVVSENKKSLFWTTAFYLTVKTRRGRERHRKGLWTNPSLADTRDTPTGSDRFVSTSNPNRFPKSTQLPHFQIRFFRYSKIRYFISQGPWCDVISLNHSIIRFISLSSSSCHAGTTDIPAPLSPLFPIVYRLWQVFWASSRILT